MDVDTAVCDCMSSWKYTMSQKKVGHFYFYDNFGKRSNFHNFFTVKFKKNLQSKIELKTIIYPQIYCLTTLWKVARSTYSFTAQLIQFKVMKNV